MPRYPKVKVSLVSEDGNAFAILGKARRAAQAAGVPPEEIAEFYREATAGDYDTLLRATIRWFDVQ